MLNQAKEVDELKKQMGQMAKFMGQIKEQGKLPRTTIVNPKGGFESVKAITLKNGKEVGTDPQPSKSTQTEDEKLQQEEDVQHTPTARKETTLPCTPTLPNPSNLSTTGKKGSNSVNSNVIPPNAPFPRRFMQTQNEESEKDILETFRKVQVNIPLLDAIKQIPKKLPPKCKDPGSFTIPCVIGNTRFEHAMLDLGASINVTPYSVYASMNL
ncbi:hypothetical protein PS2_027617 [Malus domestica]